jgi:hypothetical protein
MAVGASSRAGEEQIGGTILIHVPHTSGILFQEFFSTVRKSIL